MAEKAAALSNLTPALFVLLCLCYVTTSGPQTSPTVNIGIIVDRLDSASINESVELAMKASNQTKYAKMYPVIRETNLSDSFELRQTFCSLVERQTPALIGTSKSSTYNVIESYSRALKMPVFQLSLPRETLYDDDSYVISMCPSFIQPVIDVIKFFQWDRIFYLFDSDDALWRLQKLYRAFHTPPEADPEYQLLVDAIRVPDVFNCREVLRKLDKNYNFENKRIIVDLSSLKAYERFMSQIIDVGMNRDGYHYVLGTLDITSITKINKDLWKSFTYGGVNMTGFQLINRKKWANTERVRKVLAELGEDELSIEVALTVDAVAVLTTALAELWKTEETRKLVFPFRRGKIDYSMNCSSVFKAGTLILDSIKKVSTEGLSGKLGFDDNGHRSGFTFDIFHLSYRSPLKQVGEWVDGKLTTSLISQGKPKVVKPENRTRIVTTVVNAPFIQLKREENDGVPLLGNDRFEGFCVDMMEIIAEKCNFTYILQQREDEVYGANDNGTWNGMIGELINDEADMALASLTITRERSEVVRFTKPYMNTGISIMIKKPEKSKPGVLSFMEPLSYRVWGCIACGFFAVSFILYMVGRFSPYEWQEEGSNSAPSDVFSFVNTLWFSLGALMQQGPDIFPRSLSGRTLGSAWWFFTLIIISSYTANLAAFLTFEKLTTPINSADDLPKQRKIKYGCQGAGTTKEFFENSRVSVYQQMWSFMSQEEPSVFEENSYKGWRRVVDGKEKYAFLLESAVNNYYNQKKPCKTMRVGRLLDHKGYGIATPKNSDLSRKLNIAVLEMSEYGELWKLEQKWWLSKGECGATDSGGKGKSALNLSNVAGIFHILIGGLVLSMIISLSQIVYNSKIRPKARQGSYQVNTTRQPLCRANKSVTIEENPIVTCTESNGGVRSRDDLRDPHLISFEDSPEKDNPTSIRHNLYS